LEGVTGFISIFDYDYDNALFRYLARSDRVAVKPHASLVFLAITCLGIRN